MIEKVIVDALTPAHAPGFLERLEVLFSEAGVHKRGYISFLIESTGLSKSGARRILNDQRPPKRQKAFDGIVNGFAALLRAKHGQMFDEQDIADYLLNAHKPGFIHPDDEFDLSTFLASDPVHTSQVILKVDQIIHDRGNKSIEISERDLRLIHHRIISYSIKNSVDPSSEKLTSMIESLVALSMENLL